MNTLRLSARLAYAGGDAFVQLARIGCVIGPEEGGTRDIVLPEKWRVLREDSAVRIYDVSGCDRAEVRWVNGMFGVGTVTYCQITFYPYYLLHVRRDKELRKVYAFLLNGKSPRRRVHQLQTTLPYTFGSAEWYAAEHAFLLHVEWVVLERYPDYKDIAAYWDD